MLYISVCVKLTSRCGISCGKILGDKILLLSNSYILSSNLIISFNVRMSSVLIYIHKSVLNLLAYFRCSYILVHSYLPQDKSYNYIVTWLSYRFESSSHATLNLFRIIFLKTVITFPYFHMFLISFLKVSHVSIRQLLTSLQVEELCE